MSATPYTFCRLRNGYSTPSVHEKTVLREIPRRAPCRRNAFRFHAFLKTRLRRFAAAKTAINQAYGSSLNFATTGTTETKRRRSGANGTSMLMQQSPEMNLTGSGKLMQLLTRLFKREKREPWKHTAPAFALKEDGLYCAKESDKGRICSPVEVVALGIEGKIQGFVLLKLFDQDKNPCECVLGHDELNGSNHDYIDLLLTKGAKIEVGREKLLLQYIRNTQTDARFRVTSSVGWQDGFDSYVLPEEVFGKQPDLRIVFYGGSDHRFNTAGTLQDWKEHVSKRCVGNSRLTFAVSCAFAGSLLPLVISSGAGFHFRGTTSTGKSTALKVAGSVLGGGGRNHEQGFLRSWNSTLNGLESVAKLHNHALLCLDEIGQADSKKIGAAAYMLANGLGRERMKSDLTRREAAAWSLVLLSSGEKSLSDHAQEAGQKIKGGQEVRLMDIPADAGTGLGLFEEIHGAASSKAFAEALGEASCRFYGVAYRDWLATLVERRAAWAVRAKELIAEFEREHIPDEAGHEVGRAAHWFGLMAAAGELATAAGITGWPEGEAKRGAAKCFEDWLGGRSAGTGSADEEEWIAQVRLFLELHGASRFEDGDWKGEFPQRISNRAGVRRGKEFWISREVFRAEVCKGFDAQAVAQALAKCGLLVRGEGKNLAKRPPTGKRQRCYVVLDSIFGNDDLQAQSDLPGVRVESEFADVPDQF